MQPSIENISKGFNCTILAYGQTGSGKTFTMFGSGWETNNPAPQVYYDQRIQISKSLKPKIQSGGLIPNSIFQVFNSVSSKPVTVFCSFFQIYNEKIFDLLQNPTRDKPLNIREDKETGVFVENLAEYVVESVEDCVYLLKQGDRNRVVRQTRFNHHSSRSHTIFQLLVEGDKANKRGALKRAKLNLCDLAGSEKFDKDGRMLRDHIQEMNNINKSLTILGKVISALGTGPQGHIPYRESKLTRVLQDSLGVSTRTILIATISPSYSYLEETINTLKFADRARQVMVKVTKNEISAISDSLVSKLQREIQHLKSLLNLNKKGKLQDINKELLALKEENEKLKRITKNFTVEEVEVLKQENKKLKLELQGLKEKGETGLSFFEEGKPDSMESGIGGRDWKSVVSSEDEGGIRAKLESWKNREMDEAVELLKNRMADGGRCPVCTLKIPCKHYESLEDIQKITKNKHCSLPPCPKRPLVSTVKDLDLRNFSIDQPRKLSFRTRAKNSYNEESAALSELKEHQLRKSKLKETESRLIKLSKIEAYREEKLRKEFEKLEKEREKEEEDYLKQQIKENNRKKYLEAQKKKLDDFQRIKDIEIRDLTERLQKQEEEKKKKELKKKLYLEEQKKKIVEFQSKKKLVEEVTMDQIEELGDFYLAKEVYNKKSFTFKRMDELS